MSSGKQQVTAKGIPPPPPVLSHAIISNNIVFCSGQTGKKPDGTYVEGDITERTVRGRKHDTCTYSDER